MNEISKSVIRGWQCVGCGKVEAPQPCVGICQDRAVELLPLEVHERVVERRAELADDYRRLRNFVWQAAHTTPREGRWKEGFEALQRAARQLLDDIPNRPAG